MKLGYNKVKPQPKVRPMSQYSRIDSEGREARNPFEALRRSLNLTQEQFAEKLGISKQLVQFYEANRNSPTPRTWMKMKENATRHNIVLSDDLLLSLVGEKLEKRKKRIEDKFKAEIEKLNEKINVRKCEIEKLSESYQELTNRYGGKDESD